MTTETFISAVLPAALGLVAGVVGSFAAPWAQWAVEKRRERMRRRREVLDSWRQYLETEFDWNTFRDTAVFSQMKPELTAAMVRELDPPKTSGKPSVRLRATFGGDDLVKRLLAEVAEIERKWGLV